MTTTLYPCGGGSKYIPCTQTCHLWPVSCSSTFSSIMGYGLLLSPDADFSLVYPKVHPLEMKVWKSADISALLINTEYSFSSTLKTFHHVSF